MKRTNRGFAIFGEIKDTRGCVVRVQMSSAVGGPFVWIFTDEPNKVYEDGKAAPHLSRAQAKRVIAALQRFVDGDA